MLPYLLCYLNMYQMTRCSRVPSLHHSLTSLSPGAEHLTSMMSTKSWGRRPHVSTNSRWNVTKLDWMMVGWYHITPRSPLYHIIRLQGHSVYLKMMVSIVYMAGGGGGGGQLNFIQITYKSCNIHNKPAWPKKKQMKKRLRNRSNFKTVNMSFPSC